MNLKRLVLVPLASIVVLAQFFGCAKAHKVPRIDVEHLPRVAFKGVEPRSVAIDVQNLRAAVESAGNAGAVEGAIRGAIKRVLEDSAIVVDASSPNLFLVRISDYEKAKKEDGECVELRGSLQLKSGTALRSESYSCQTNGALANIQLGGDLDKAYEGAIRGLLKATDKKLQELSK